MPGIISKAMFIVVKAGVISRSVSTLKTERMHSKSKITTSAQTAQITGFSDILRDKAAQSKPDKNIHTKDAGLIKTKGSGILVIAAEIIAQEISIVIKLKIEEISIDIAIFPVLFLFFFCFIFLSLLRYRRIICCSFYSVICFQSIKNM